MSEPPITRFPSELLVNVFNKLPDLEKPICSLVCARWRSVVKRYWPNLHDSPYELLYYGVKNGDKKQVSLAKQLGATILRKGLTHGMQSDKNRLNREEFGRLYTGLCELVNITENGPIYYSRRMTADIIMVHQIMDNPPDKSAIIDKDLKCTIMRYVLEPRKKSSKFIIPVIRNKIISKCSKYWGIFGWEWTGEKPIQFTALCICFCGAKKVIKVSPGEKKVDSLYDSLFLNFPCRHGFVITLSETPKNGSFYFYEIGLPNCLLNRY